jgi:hypothetical protein
MTMVFTQDFKRQCSEAFQYSVRFAQIMESLESGHGNAARQYMDEALDDLQLEINQRIGPDEHSIHNARVDQLHLMYEAWYGLMDLTDALLDKKNDVLRKSIN